MVVFMVVFIYILRKLLAVAVATINWLLHKCYVLLSINSLSGATINCILHVLK